MVNWASENSQSIINQSSINEDMSDNNISLKIYQSRHGQKHGIRVTARYCTEGSNLLGIANNIIMILMSPNIQSSPIISKCLGLTIEKSKNHYSQTGPQDKGLLQILVQVGTGSKQDFLSCISNSFTSVLPQQQYCKLFGESPQGAHSPG